MIFSKTYVVITYKNSSENYQKNTGNEISVGKVLDSRQEGSGSRLAPQKSAIGTIKNPSCVQCPTRFCANYTSVGKKVEEISGPWRIKFIMSCVRTTLRS